MGYAFPLETEKQLETTTVYFFWLWAKDSFIQLLLNIPGTIAPLHKEAADRAYFRGSADSPPLGD